MSKMSKNPKESKKKASKESKGLRYIKIQGVFHNGEHSHFRILEMGSCAPKEEAPGSQIQIIYRDQHLQDQGDGEFGDGDSDSPPPPSLVNLDIPLIPEVEGRIGMDSNEELELNLTLSSTFEKDYLLNQQAEGVDPVELEELHSRATIILKAVIEPTIYSPAPPEFVGFQPTPRKLSPWGEILFRILKERSSAYPPAHEAITRWLQDFHNDLRSRRAQNQLAVITAVRQQLQNTLEAFYQGSQGKKGAKSKAGNVKKVPDFDVEWRVLNKVDTQLAEYVALLLQKEVVSRINEETTGITEWRQRLSTIEHLFQEDSDDEDGVGDTSQEDDEPQLNMNLD